MGFDISSQNKTGLDLTMSEAIEIGDYARFNIDAWPMLLRMARSYGWKPAGTQPGPDYADHNLKPTVEWDGTYLTNDGQVVMAEDAAALADAIERALPDIPDHEITGKMVSLRPDQLKSEIDLAFRDLIAEGMSLIATNPDMSPYELFSGEMKQQVIGFIKLCRKGSFAIW
jgi:hypothetical protein